MVRTFLILVLLGMPRALSQDAAAPDRTPNFPSTVDVRRVSPSELISQKNAGGLVPVATDVLQQLLKRRAASRLPAESPVRRAELSATLRQNSLRDGELRLELESAETPGREYVSLGGTNLDRLRLYSGGLPLTLATDSRGHLVPLIPPASTSVTGTWEATGRSVGKTTVFQLKLPGAALSVFHLQTDLKTTVTSPNALVMPKSRSPQQVIWELYPKDPDTLTISCAARDRDSGDGDISLSVATDVRVSVGTTTAAWELGLPVSLADSRLTLRLTRPCEVKSVRLEEASIGWVHDPPTGLLSIDIPGLAVPATLVVDAVAVAETETEIAVPLLVPESWKSEFGEVGGRTDLRSGTVRLIVSPELMVGEISLEGLLERDITYAADGSQTLELRQFTRNAAATLKLTPATPVVDDSVVIRVGGEDVQGQATAYVYVTARTGSLGQVSFQLPSSWRVTAVREMVSGLPLLFRVSDPETTSQMAEVEAMLRSPVSGESGQGIIALLQSTEQGNSAVREYPALVNTQYHREADLLCFAAADVPAEFSRSDVRGRISKDDLQRRLPWLPADEFEGTVAFERPARSPVAEDPGEPLERLDATIDYAVTEDSGVVTETLRVRVRTAGELPRIIPIHATVDAMLQLSEESVTQPAPLLTKDRAGADFDIWTLEFPPGTAETGELDVTLTCSRPVSEQMPVTLVEVPAARQTGGALQPPAADSGVELRLNTPVLQPRQYPDRPFDGSWTLVSDSTSEPRLEVSGMSFLLLHRVGERLAADVLHRITVDSGAGDPMLVASFPHVATPSILVDGRSVFADRNGSQLLIPLTRESDRSVVTMLYSMELTDIDDGSLRLPQVTFPDADGGQSVSFLMPPAGYRLDSASVNLTRQPVDDVTSLLTQGPAAAAQPASEPGISAFPGRWKLRALSNSAVYCADVDVASKSVLLRLSRHRFDAAGMIMASTLILLAWLLIDVQWRISMWIPAAVLGIVSLAAFRAVPLSVVAAGIPVGTILFGLQRLARFVLSRIHRDTLPQRNVLTFPATVLLLWLPGSAFALGAEEAKRPVVYLSETNGGAAPFAYVKQDFLSELRMHGAVDDEAVFVVSSTIEMEMESPQSCVIDVECVVASSPDEERRLTIPLEGMSLTACALDGNSVFPERHSSGAMQLVIAPSYLLKPVLLGGNDVSPSSAAPATLGSLDLHRVSYTVRGVPRRSPRDYRLVVPYPPSAEVHMSFRDRSGLVESVSIPELADPVPVRLDQAPSWFPPVFNSQVADLTLQFRDARNSSAGRMQRSSMVCMADVTPSRQKLTCEYRVSPADTRFDKVLIGMDPRYQITRVESTDGDPLVWSLDADQLIAEVAPDSSGVQSFIVQQVYDPPIDLRHRVPIGVLSMVNGLPADTAAVFVGTTDQFVISAVGSPEQPLEEGPVTAAVRDFKSIQGALRMVDVPRDVDTVQIELAELKATRVARMTQSVVVSDDHVDWQCRCEIEVAGQPVFRQTVRISPEVRVSRVSVRSAGVSRLQSWTRHRDQVVVSLREGTRGLLELEFEGTVSREPDRDTVLPVVQLPAAIEITESDLELSASAEINTYISDLGAALPSDAIDIERTPLSATPIRMGIADESRPLTIRGNPEKLVTAEVAIFLYQVAGEDRCAQFLKMRTPNVAFDLRFRCPQPEFGDSRPLMVTNGDVSTVESSDQGFVVPRSRTSGGDSEFTLAFPAMPAPVSVAEVTCPVPTFDAKIQVTSCEAFDLRDAAAGSASPSVPLPGWMAEAAVQAGIADQLSLVPSAVCRFDEESGVVRIRPPRTPSAPAVVADTPGVLLVQTQHQLSCSAEMAVAGISDFTVFRTQTGYPVTIQIPPDVIVANLTVDGESQAFQIEANAIVLFPSGRITSVSAFWFGQTVARDGGEHGLPLPLVSAPRSYTQVVVVPPSPLPVGWSLQNETVSLAASRSHRSHSLMQGLQELGIDASDTGASDNDASEAKAGREKGGISPALWGLVGHESELAAQAWSHRVGNFDDHATRGGRVVILEGDEQIRISTLTLPSPLAGASALSALAMLVLPWLVRIRKRRQTPVTSASAADTKSDIIGKPEQSP
ncbi:MAG: hypothetical protein RIK87_21730 [Fuerstiella sp.]